MKQLFGRAQRAYSAILKGYLIKGANLNIIMILIFLNSEMHSRFSSVNFNGFLKQCFQKFINKKKNTFIIDNAPI